MVKKLKYREIMVTPCMFKLKMYTDIICENQFVSIKL